MKKQIFTTVLLFSFTFNFAQVKDIPFTKFAINTVNCNSLIYKTGSRIYIPENAFVLENDAVCTTEITFKYREIRTSLDMFVSKIPMIYRDDKGSNHLLESGGMFEMEAECNGKKLKLAKNKQIQVRFSITEKMEGLEGFYFNENTNFWDKIDNPISDFGVATNTNNVDALWGSGTVNTFDQFSQWGEGDEFFDEGSNNWEDINKKQTEVFKSMNVDEMGLYNYDAILKEDDRIPILASFKLKGIVGELNLVYVAYEGINTLIYFNKTDWKTTFALLPRSDYKIFAIDKDGRVAVFSDEDKQKIDIQSLNGKEYTFELVLEELIPQNKKDLALITGLK